MEYQKIINLQDTTSNSVPKFNTKKWIEVHDQSGNAKNRYKPSKQTRIKTSVLKSDLCDYSDAYIVVKGTITVTGENNRDRKNRFLAFENNASFISCISKINLLIDNAGDLEVVMPMYNLIEYCKNYRKTTGSLWNYYRDEPNNPPNDNYNADPITNSASFKYKSSLIRKTPNNDNNDNNKVKDVQIFVPLKYLSNF